MHPHHYSQVWDALPECDLRENLIFFSWPQKDRADLHIAIDLNL